jgi:hypothetical protein
MEKILNDSIMHLVNEGRLSAAKIQLLINIKDFIDRISDRKYLVGETPESMIVRYGAAPDIITWGDYFQTDLAMTAVEQDDAEFEKTIETVRFDIMASWDICSSNGPEFFEWVQDANTSLWIAGTDAENFTDEEKEIAHLKVLVEYFTNMGLNGNFYESELIWYHAFFAAQKQQEYTA